MSTNTATQATTQANNGTPVTTQVLVIGGSLVGLSAAVFLAAQKVPTIVVEKHPGSSLHPRAIGYTPRTLENYKAAGVRVPELQGLVRLRRVKARSLAGEWFDESAWTPEKAQAQGQQGGQGPQQGHGGPHGGQGGPQGGQGHGGPQGGHGGQGQKPGGPPGGQLEQMLKASPHIGATIAQDALEPILRDKAREFGADVRVSTELLRFTQDEHGIIAHVRSRTDNHEYEIRAKYMIACDGYKSKVRDALGIKCTGRGHIRSLSSVLFRAPLQEYLEKGVFQFQIEQPGFEAFITTYNDGRWVVMASSKDTDTSTAAAQRALVERAVGRSDIDIEIVTTGKWELSAYIADKYSQGRVFLAGDAAHTLPPSRGGWGANTGIEDVHNLAWKLAAVLRGEVKEELLDTYDAERRPIGYLRHDQIFTRPDYAEYADKTKPPMEILDDAAMELGQLYRSSAIIGAGAELPPAARPDQWAGQPGTRAAHVWMTKKGEKERFSSLDFFQRSWVLLSESTQWCDAAAHATAQVGVKVTSTHIGDEVNSEEPGEFRKLYGLGEKGAALVRPDGYIAWRCAELPANHAEMLSDVLKRVSAAK